VADEQTDTGTDETASTPTGGSDPVQAEVEKWKALARKHERESAAQAKRAQTLEDRDRTESEKAAARAEAAEKRAEAAETRALRGEIADDEGIKAAHRKYLSGSTEDELRESANGIRSDFADAYRETSPTSTRPGSPVRPVESLRPGKGGEAANPGDTDAWLRGLARSGRQTITR
jgi:hypothetical protein